MNLTRSRNTANFKCPPPLNKDPHFINGLEDFYVSIQKEINSSDSKMIEILVKDDFSEINFINFPPGSVIVFSITVDEEVNYAVKELWLTLGELGFDKTKLINISSSLDTIISECNLIDLNIILFHCDAEERDDCQDRGAYVIEPIGGLIYCGLQGFMTLLKDIVSKNDLGHPLCNNLRLGNWMLDYISARFLNYEGTSKLGFWIQNIFSLLKKLPRFLLPCYFAAFISAVYMHCLKIIWLKMGDFIQNGSNFVHYLALGSVQCGSFIKSAKLPPLAPTLDSPLPQKLKQINGNEEHCLTSLAAGLPHFSTGYMRNWGRDTFISLRALFILCSRYQEARYIILAYAGCLRHGLIPNLLDGGVNARYNCRDAVWWWLQSIQEYVHLAPNGSLILKDKVSRMYPTDESLPQFSEAYIEPLSDTIQEAMEKHFEGVLFTERNAGVALDSHMKDIGFNNNIGISLETGFVYGGNEYNCGTWMDKMGSSEKAGTKGKPATSRDGSAIELIALCKSTVQWLQEMYEKEIYPYKGVKRKFNGKLITWTWAEWNDRIKENFEKCFWIDENKQNDINHHHPQHINQRGIYKDVYGSSQAWSDYQLRCNFPVAMTIAPDLFNAERAWIALNKADKLLRGPLGMKTLDPSDWNYRGNYNNSNDSHDPYVAHGFNYHQGPEWLWPLGYFLRARLYFAKLIGGTNKLTTEMNYVQTILSKHFLEIEKSSWCGLPELTNENGAYCPDSCPVQAWSMASLLEVMHDLHLYGHLINTV